jgi:hypothetical protein
MSKPPLETRWGLSPTEDIPLRPTLLNISDHTRERVVDYALRQPKAAVLPWLFKRQMEYWDRHGYAAGTDRSDRLHQKIDATCAVDLLQWQAGIQEPKAAVEWLKALDALAEFHARTFPKKGTVAP